MSLIPWPTLTDPEVVVLDNPTSGTIMGTPGTDYLIVSPAALDTGVTDSATLSFDGGNPDGTGPPSNVVFTSIDAVYPDKSPLYPSENAGDGVAYATARAGAIFNHRGTVMYDGCSFDGYAFTEGLNCFSNWTDMIVQQCRIGSVQYPCQTRHFGAAGYPTIHPDAVSMGWGKSLRINYCDMFPAYQGLFVVNENQLGFNCPDYVTVEHCNMVCCLQGADLPLSCVRVDGTNTVSGNLRDSMLTYSLQTSAQAQRHAWKYSAAVAWRGAIVTYKCDVAATPPRSLGTSVQASTSLTITCPTSSPVEPGETIFAAVQFRAGTIVSVSGGGLAWTLDIVAPPTGPGTLGVALASAYAPAGLAAGTVITATQNATNLNKDMILAAAAGVKAVAPADKTANVEQNVSTFPAAIQTPATAVTSQNDELVLGVCTAGFAAGGTLAPAPLDPPTVSEAGQVYWDDDNHRAGPDPLPDGPPPITYGTDCWLDITRLVSDTNPLHHVHPSSSDATASRRPTLNSDGIGSYIEWVGGGAPWITAGSKIYVGARPGGDVTLPKNTPGGPGYRYREADFELYGKSILVAR